MLQILLNPFLIDWPPTVDLVLPRLGWADKLTAHANICKSRNGVLDSPPRHSCRSRDCRNCIDAGIDEVRYMNTPVEASLGFTNVVGHEL